MKKFLKETVKSLLRKMGLLKWIRKYMYSRSKRKFITFFKGLSYYEFRIGNRKVKFSVQDPYSAVFAGFYLKDKVYEPEAVQLLFRELTPNDVFVDVGANIGYFSILVGAYCPGIKIIAFEMAHENFQILKKNIQLNNLTGVEAYECAVSDHTGRLFYQDSAVGNAVLKILDENTNNNPDVVKVESVSLDDFFSSKPIKPTFIKIDVEGAEMRVLQGMKELLNCNLKLLIEIHPKDLLEFGSNREEVLDYLRRFYFTILPIQNNDRKNELVFAWK